MEDEERIGIVNPDNYKSADHYSYKEICMKQFSKVVNNLSQEHRSGFWIYSDNPNTAPRKTRYIGDSRKEIKNSIDCLHDILQPRFDKTMKEQSESLYKEIVEVLTKDKDNDEEKDENPIWKSVFKVYRKLFQQICLFLERLSWFESSDEEDVD